MKHPFLDHLNKAEENAKIAMDLSSSLPLPFPLSVSRNNVVITGMGGSGIAGSMVSEFYDKIPIFLNSGSRLPSAKIHVVISYSGDTKETLESFEEGLNRNLRTICITSGGKLAKRAEENEVDLIKIPSGYLPREAILFMLIPALSLFGKLDEKIPLWLAEMNEKINDEVEEERNPAKKLAAEIGNRIPIVYSYSPFVSLAKRFKQQVNENCKGMSFFNLLPELNHNEIESFSKKNKDFIVISIGDKFDDTYNIIGGKCEIAGVKLYGRSRIEKLFKTLYFIDYSSVYLAFLRGVDPAEMPNINRLKSKNQS